MLGNEFCILSSEDTELSHRKLNLNRSAQALIARVPDAKPDNAADLPV